MKRPQKQYSNTSLYFSIATLNPRNVGTKETAIAMARLVRKWKITTDLMHCIAEDDW